MDGRIRRGVAVFQVKYRVGDSFPSVIDSFWVGPGPPLELASRAPLEVARPEGESVEARQEAGQGGGL